jgi:threonine/homoserine efflux transporter RhtA
MNFSLVGANRTTHFKIVALAIAGTVLLGFAMRTSNPVHANIANAMSKPQSQSVLHAENVTVCQYSAL